MSVGRFWSWVKNGTSLRHTTNVFNSANQNMTLKMPGDAEARPRVDAVDHGGSQPHEPRRQKK